MATHGGNRNGATLVEFALVLPIIITFFFATVELSRVLMLQHTADTAAYEAAREGIVPGATSGEVIVVADEMLDSAGIEQASVDVTPDQILEETALITVNVEIPVSDNSWIAPHFFFGGSVTSEVSLFCERSPIIRLTGIPKIKAKKKKMKGDKPDL